MIAKLTGILDEIGDGWAVVDVNGVGYLVHSSARTLDKLPTKGEAVQFFIETVVREDAFLLYGFGDKQEKECFTLLCSVQGVGAKVGLAILSVGSPSEIQTAIAAQDKGVISRASGVGPKLAGRIINELKDKVASLAVSTASQMPSDGSVSASPVNDKGDQVLADAVSALSNLGYRPAEAHTAVAMARSKVEGNISVNALIPLALKELASL
ncbi:Holliday junction branch migration protein RuvA [Temperatibacter marinus]|uniref:Holliday junction branch migration complex subunit RuvA n=1 Tax=Temperatibacter marinus TaxID=1456591 RepID=A0AA52EF07_9PROT|nr:Holliday junction branch migration protein RuvA [Temperatibacter marinus]WND01878.1 Holliday junction branch migration protein RuvA [Temperatibacter marinus]